MIEVPTDVSNSCQSSRVGQVLAGKRTCEQSLQKAPQAVLHAAGKGAQSNVRSERTDLYSIASAGKGSALRTGQPGIILGF